MHYASRTSVAWAIEPQERKPAPLLRKPSLQHRDQNALADAAMGRYARGDDGAFDELYRLLQPRLYRLCLYLAGRNDADELMQDVFLKIHRARSSFVETGSIVAWSSAIARTTHLDRCRRSKRRPEVRLEYTQLERYPATSHSDPEAVYSHTITERVLERELAGLSENLRSAYILVRLQGLSCAEASAALGVSIDAVKQRIHRATEILRAGMFCVSSATAANTGNTVDNPVSSFG